MMCSVVFSLLSIATFSFIISEKYISNLTRRLCLPCLWIVDD